MYYLHHPHSVWCPAGLLAAHCVTEEPPQQGSILLAQSRCWWCSQSCELVLRLYFPPSLFIDLSSQTNTHTHKLSFLYGFLSLLEHTHALLWWAICVFKTTLGSLCVCWRICANILKTKAKAQLGGISVRVCQERTAWAGGKWTNIRKEKTKWKQIAGHHIMPSALCGSLIFIFCSIPNKS